MPRRNLAAWLGFALLLAVSMPAPALSLELEAAKRDGLVGVVVANPSPDVEKLVDSVNAKRRAKYQQIAKENGTSFDAVAALAGAKLVERAAKGEFVTDAQGNWFQKK